MCRQFPGLLCNAKETATCLLLLADSPYVRCDADSIDEFQPFTVMPFALNKVALIGGQGNLFCDNFWIVTCSSSTIAGYEVSCVEYLGGNLIALRSSANLYCGILEPRMLRCEASVTLDQATLAVTKVWQFVLM
jgi:hypothetical protein